MKDGSNSNYIFWRFVDLIGRYFHEGRKTYIENLRLIKYNKLQIKLQAEALKLSDRL